ncbi:MAG: M81 family metallopeptidase [Burkholderiaceae bacterium]|nr:M81 family metallopeptidase [Burkholderiaceae bacterium]
MSHRIFTACLGTETNSFSPIPTGLGLFGRTMLVRNGEHGAKPSLFAMPLMHWRERGRALGWTVIEGLAAFATPAGETTRSAFEALRDEILADLERAMPVDAVLLTLHGAMVAHGYVDAEGELLARIRARVGPDVPILAELDLHGHMTELKLHSADALVYFKEYPHVDVPERADEVFELARRMLDEGLRPRMAMHDCRMLGIYPTTREPLRGFVDRMQAMEREVPGILSISLVHGFPWSDTPEVGTRVLVVTDNDLALAQRTAKALGDWIWEHRDALVAPFVSIDTAIDAVLDARPDGRPFVLADTADNTGIGASGDSTFMLSRLIERGAGGFAISPLWDPVATEMAFDGGVGAEMPVRIGGKLGPASGDPVDATVTVMGLVERATQPFGRSISPLGNMAWLRISLDGALPGDDSKAIDVIVNDYRVQSFDPQCFSAVGLDPARPRALIVKSTQHFHAGFAPIAREILYVSAPGSGSMNFGELPHRRVSAPLWPRLDDPHLIAGPADLT